MYDKLVARFAWGTAKTFASLTGEKSTRLAEYTKLLAHYDNLIVEAQFAKGTADNSTENEIKGWIKKLQEVKPQEIHILTGAGLATEKKKVKPITPTRRQQIVDEVVEKTGLAVSVHDDEEMIPA
jgi:hypothetical protein